MLLQSWTEVTVNSFQEIWGGFIGFLPSLLGALVVLLVGWAIAIGLHRLITQLLRAVRLDAGLEKLGLGQFFDKAGIKIDFAGWIGNLVKWFFVLVFLLAATDILNLTEISIFLRSVLNYIPSIVVAVVILTASFWLANVLRKIVQASVAASNIKAAAFTCTVTYWAILIFGFFAALIQLGIAFALFQTLITGIIAMLALAGGLAFGLGGKDAAASFLSRLKKEMSE